jgi:hypothetical protein
MIPSEILNLILYLSSLHYTTKMLNELSSTCRIFYNSGYFITWRSSLANLHDCLQTKYLVDKNRLKMNFHNTDFQSINNPDLIFCLCKIDFKFTFNFYDTLIFISTNQYRPDLEMIFRAILNQPFVNFRVYEDDLFRICCENNNIEYAKMILGIIPDTNIHLDAERVMTHAIYSKHENVIIFLLDCSFNGIQKQYDFNSHYFTYLYCKNNAPCASALKIITNYYTEHNIMFEGAHDTEFRGE